ncbi:hypothetical protein BDK51DRAFT_30082 [Blyttiomyces helicus]|uniref:Uncharacterized protein n=1 Tax=Blyttiomyces helicus TaxID=388810 RepID=A0A4P9WT93_9FUNG|nr:hypothetical protein BDK51DRAFT_30082 [Blyttiomyces helicus]|eukprot:RKO94276.1 hypothetical protein BDK51DRAFT_30082 [Blyttiomyces helicus]
MNILYAQNIQINNTIAYGKGADLDVLFSEIVALFPDDLILKELMSHSFVGNASRLGRVIYQLGKEHFGVGNNSAKRYSFANAQDTEMAKKRALLFVAIMKRLQDKDRRTVIKPVEFRESKDIILFLRGIMPNEEEFSYLLRWLATSLLGSKTNEISNHNFDRFWKKWKRLSSSSPSVDLLNLRGKCWITGPYNYQNTEVTFYLQRSLALQCNSIPALDGEDEAIWDCGSIIDFLFKLVDSAVG